MTIDLDPNELGRSIAATIDSFCADRCDEAVVRQSAEAFPLDLWRDLAALGVFDLASLSDETGATEIAIACEALGRADFPGPIAATYLAAEVLDGDARAAVTSGRSLVSFGDASLMPWAPLAQVFLAWHDGGVWRCEAKTDVEAVATLAGEPWGRVTLSRQGQVGDGEHALAVFNVAHAAWMAASARSLVSRAAEHAGTRRQFGRPLGDFQAVAHPLADCAMQLDAAAALARAAACALDAGDTNARVLAPAARRSADSAAARTVVVCHQVFGAIGITTEGPVFHTSRRLQQASAVPPSSRGDDARLVASIAAPGAHRA
jgi:hypothetical protein